MSAFFSGITDGFRTFREARLLGVVPRENFNLVGDVNECIAHIEDYILYNHIV